MTEEHRSEINRKQRKTYHRKKADSMLSKVSNGNTGYHRHEVIWQLKFQI
jgi:hypothetical protein